MTGKIPKPQKKRTNKYEEKLKVNAPLTDLIKIALTKPVKKK